MEALADKVHRQGEHIPQHSYISHNHPYTSSSDTLVGAILIFTPTYVGMVVWNVAMLWNMLSLFVYFVSQCHPANISIFGRFLLEINYGLTVAMCVCRSPWSSVPKRVGVWIAHALIGFSVCDLSLADMLFLVRWNHTFTKMVLPSTYMHI